MRIRFIIVALLILSFQGTAHGLFPVETFKACDACPEMVVVPAGQVTLAHGTEAAIDRFAVGIAEVSFEQWHACVADGGCNGYRPHDMGWNRQDLPVIYVSWHDAQAYLAWLNSQSNGPPYRLLTEAEWVYVARAGTTTAYWWGDAISHQNAAYGWSPQHKIITQPIKSFQANGFGLYHVHGNVWEWVADCAKPTQASCPQGRVLRGGGWLDHPRFLRADSRIASDPKVRLNDVGFRIARDLD